MANDRNPNPTEPTLDVNVIARPGALLPAKAWRMAEKLTREVQGKLMRFAFTPRIDRFDGIPKIELQVRDWEG